MPELPQDPLSMLLLALLLAVMVIRDLLRQRRETNAPPSCLFDAQEVERMIDRVLDHRELQKLRAGGRNGGEST